MVVFKENCNKNDRRIIRKLTYMVLIELKRRYLCENPTKIKKDYILRGFLHPPVFVKIHYERN